MPAQKENYGGLITVGWHVGGEPRAELWSEAGRAVHRTVYRGRVIQVYSLPCSETCDLDGEGGSWLRSAFEGHFSALVNIGNTNNKVAKARAQASHLGSRLRESCSCHVLLNPPGKWESGDREKELKMGAGMGAGTCTGFEAETIANRPLGDLCGSGRCTVGEEWIGQLVMHYARTMCNSKKCGRERVWRM